MGKGKINKGRIIYQKFWKMGPREWEIGVMTEKGEMKVKQGHNSGTLAQQDWCPDRTDTQLYVLRE